MRSLLLTGLLSFVATLSFAQFTYKIKADSVLITNDSCTAELNLENSTKHLTGGVLYNRWNGRTEFRKLYVKVNDSTYTLGEDTLDLSGATGDFIANQTSLQSSANFHISGNGIIRNKLAVGKPSASSRLDVLDERTGLTYMETATISNYGSSLTGVGNSAIALRVVSASEGNVPLNTGISVESIATGTSNSAKNVGIIAQIANGNVGESTAGWFMNNGGHTVLRVQQLHSSYYAGMIFVGPSGANWGMGKTTAGDFVWNNSPFFSGYEPMRFSGSTGNVGFAVITPTARIHIRDGSTAAGTAPLKFTQGPSLTTPEHGAVEFNGTNLFLTSSTTRYTLAKTLTETATLNFGSTSAGNSADLTITVTGAADGDAVSLGVPNSAVNANSNFTAWVSASNTVTVRFNNYSSGAIDPASATFRVSVLKY